MTFSFALMAAAMTTVTAVTPATTTDSHEPHSLPPQIHSLLSDAPQRYAAVSTNVVPLNQEGVYNRPFVASAGQGAVRTALGGYLETAAHYFVEDGVSEGFSLEMRRFNLFVYSSIARRLKMLAELEFEHGTEEIALETALLDVELSPALTLRGGIILPAVGRFNQNHDAPLYEFVERPLVSTQIIPSTLSEVGAGLYGRFLVGDATMTYDLYFMNGLGSGVVLNADSRTSLAAGKDEAAFAEDNNGFPSFNSRLALAHDRFGEVGLSWYGGPYNDFRAEGETVAPKLWLHILAVDLEAAIQDLQLQGEFAWNRVDVPGGLAELFAERQYGLYLDAIYPLFDFNWGSNYTAVINGAVRIDRVDFNLGKFGSTGDRIYDEETVLSIGPSIRPVADTVFRINYRTHWIRDLLGNPAVRRSGFQFGLATYF